MKAHIEHVGSYIEQISALIKRGNELSKDGRVFHPGLDAIHDKHHKLRNRAAKDFAKLNGWRLSDHNFSVAMLIGGDVAGPDDCWYCKHLGNSALFDRLLFFRQAQQRLARAVAIVSEPDNTTPEEARTMATELGLDLHVPPNPSAGWHYPPHTRFFCFTRPGTPVRFLPEQMA